MGVQGKGNSSTCLALLSNSADKRKPELPRSTPQQGHSQAIFPTFIVKQERKEGEESSKEEKLWLFCQFFLHRFSCLVSIFKAF